MADSPVDMHYLQQLRDKAEALLLKGNVKASRGHFLSIESLTVLFKLASSPDNAADCLKMLHEFQTHQIELDLQLEQIEANERENAVALAHYQALYEYAPVGYLIVNREGIIIESNNTLVALFRLDRVDLEGQTLKKFLAPDSWLAIKWQLEKLFNGSPRERCTVLTNDNIKAHPLCVTSSLASGGDTVFMTIAEQDHQKPV